MTLKAAFDRVPVLIKVGVGVGLVAVLSLFLWYKGTQVWNGVGNWLFHRQINAERQKVQKDLDEAAKIKPQLEQALKDLKEKDEAYQREKAESDRLREIFHDSSKTASEKVAEFKATLGNEPDHTATDNVTTDDLCNRAKAIGASQATIAALCGQ